jgi:thioredoxin 1
MVSSITDDNFQEAIKGTDKLVLVDFWAEWCGPCKSLAPALEEASSDLEEKIAVYKIDIDANPVVPQKYGVRAVPTIVFFRNGEEVDRQVGMLPKSKLYEKIEKVIHGW